MRGAGAYSSTRRLAVWRGAAAAAAMQARGGAELLEVREGEVLRCVGDDPAVAT